MQDRPALKYGAQPGLRFACLLDGKGGCRDIGWPEIEAWQPGDGVLWVHLERDDPAAQDWLRERSGVDRFAADALLAEESRPRVEDWDDALLVVLRGVNRAGENEQLLDLVPLHIWVDSKRVITLRDKDHYLLALRDTREKLMNGKGASRAGALFVRIAERLVRYLEPVVDEFEAKADELDETLLQNTSAECRAGLSDLRRRVIHLRRYLSPQRDALYRLQSEDSSWLKKSDRTRLRETTDRLLRLVESMDAVRDRTTLLHDDLAAQIAEEHSRTSNRLTTIAALLLPPSVFAGMLGANVEGIPFRDNPWAFAATWLILLAMFPIEIWLLRKIKWL